MNLENVAQLERFVAVIEIKFISATTTVTSTMKAVRYIRKVAATFVNVTKTLMLQLNPKKIVIVKRLAVTYDSFTLRRLERVAHQFFTKMFAVPLNIDVVSNLFPESLLKFHIFSYIYSI